jgi:hypothetical protein
MNQGILVVQAPFDCYITGLASLDRIGWVTHCLEDVLYNYFPSLQEF